MRNNIFFLNSSDAGIELIGEKNYPYLCGANPKNKANVQQNIHNDQTRRRIF